MNISRTLFKLNRLFPKNFTTTQNLKKLVTYTELNNNASSKKEMSDTLTMNIQSQDQPEFEKVNN